MGIVSSISSTWDSLASLGKVLLLSSRPFKACRRPESDEIVILGNGPSLREAIDSRMPALMCRSRLAVNFAANAPEYQSLAPQYYVLADGHFSPVKPRTPM